MDDFSVKKPFLRLFVGPMKAEKSTFVVRFARKYARYCNVILVNSSTDTRHQEDFIKTHSGDLIPCIKIMNLKELESRDDFKTAKIIVLDEAQFFTDLKEHVLKYCKTKSYIISSLDGDAQQNKFGQVWDLIPYCDSIKKLHALCEICEDGTPAVCTIHTNGFEKQISIDSIEGTKYLSVCRAHINK